MSTLPDNIPVQIVADTCLYIAEAIYRWTQTRHPELNSGAAVDPQMVLETLHKLGTERGVAMYPTPHLARIP